MQKTFDEWWKELNMLAEREDWYLAEQEYYRDDYNNGLNPYQVVEEELFDFEDADNSDEGFVWDIDNECY